MSTPSPCQGHTILARVKQLFLPAGLILAISLALVNPGPGNCIRQAGLVPWLIICIFVVNGWMFSFGSAKLDHLFGKAFVAGAILTLLAGPAIGLGTANLFGLKGTLLVGLVVMSAMPTTLSSAIVVTGVSGGNTTWTLLMTVGYNLMGIISTPIMLNFCLPESQQITISGAKLLINLICLVLLPFLTGWSAKKILNNTAHHPITGFIPSFCVILAVWASLSGSRDSLTALPTSTLPIIGLAAISVHVILMILAFALGHTLKIQSAERKALAFAASQKTMPVAVTVLTALGNNIGEAILVCLLFHFLQLIIDSAIASFTQD